jgi:hypothetical protein
MIPKNKGLALGAKGRVFDQNGKSVPLSVLRGGGEDVLVHLFGNRISVESYVTLPNNEKAGTSNNLSCSLGWSSPPESVDAKGSEWLVPSPNQRDYRSTIISRNDPTRDLSSSSTGPS